ncbi:Ras-specific guanine nucleotide-releasing factor 2 [Elysia marginata]|uniref:Ras-specific guanine nucleotide-releasing factor 2 n=1 Tax=Elysia marginata TaxID=1093978 RepID=A0AAV4F1C0_9GAST|nr:Ras-specific guanine nucleotide-releasing factor 2 [Elysia marginata]
MMFLNFLKVSRLQVELTRLTGIPTEKQILLVSGGHSLKADQKVMSYGAGADTNPVFLFSKKAIESQEPPIIRSAATKDVLVALRDALHKVMGMPPQIECISMGTKVACQIRDSASKILTFCKNEFKEQHLQYQGWGTVVANLEEIAQALHHSKAKFTATAAKFLPQRDQYFTMLENFSEVMDLLQRIPLLKALHEGGTVTATGAIPFNKSIGSSHSSFITSSSFVPSTLLEWITSQGQGQSLENLRHKCYQDLLVFNSQMFEHFNHQVDEVLKEVTADPLHNKELLGIERRLSDLEKRCNEAMRIAEEQNDVTQNFFLKHAANLSKTADVSSVLPNLCQTHKQQLKMMVERQQRIEALQNNFLKSKQEMSTNIHQRLSWVMHVETSIAQLDNELIFHMKSMKILQCNLELLSQVKVAPKVYADIVVETARRRKFSNTFAQWAETLAEDSTRVYTTETQRRKSFAQSIGDHFLLDTLFKGFDDVPPSFATQAPKPFDCDLPEITADDMDLLWSAAPELKEYLRISDESTFFPSSFPCKERIGSPFAHIVLPTSQSSQTEWVEQPSVVKATEAPPTKFTLPELQETMPTQNLPQVSASQTRGCFRQSKAVSAAAQEERGPSVYTTTTAILTETATYVPMSKSAATPAASGVSLVHPTRSPHPATVAASPTDREQLCRLGASPPHTESTSPPSSSEFATADFYFEDSMPSPLASSSEKQREENSWRNKKAVVEEEEEEEESSKTSTLVSSLQAELANREVLIRELEEKLKEHIASPPRQHHQNFLLSDNSITVAPCLSSSDTTTSTPPMEDALDVSLVINKFETVRISDTHMEELQQSLDQVKADLAKAKSDLFQTDKLKLDLEHANADLAKAKDNLYCSELALTEKEEEGKRALLEKDTMIQCLKAQLASAKGELVKASEVGTEQEKRINSLQETVLAHEIKAKELTREVTMGKESLEQVKGKLITVRDSLITDLSPLKQDLVKLRSSIISNKAEFQATVVSTLGSVQKVVCLFSKETAAAAESQREALQEEIQQLKAKLHAAESATAEQLVHLQTVKEDCGAQLSRAEVMLAKKLSEAKAEFDVALKDQATKHALEMELELEKCASELKEKEEAVARQTEELAVLRERLAQEVKEAKLAAEEERELLALAYSNNLRQAEDSNAKELEAVTARLRKEFEAALETSNQEAEKKLAEQESEQDALRLEMQNEHAQAIVSLREQLEQDHEGATSRLREQMEREHKAAADDLKAQVSELKESLTSTLEQTQLDHANKLTQLKAEFDQERETLQTELDSYRDRPRSDSSTQPDPNILALHQACGETQTESQDNESGSNIAAAATAEGVNSKITSSETQTDMNLLADVISLNSSISFSSEEMIANKMSASLTGDDKEGKLSSTDTTPVNTASTQDTIDDLNLQLACAQEKIAAMNEEIRTLRDKVKEANTATSPLRPELSRLLSAASEGSSAGKMEGAQAAYQDMMASSCTAASFILMEGDQQGKAVGGAQTDPQIVKSKDQKIAHLEKKLKDVSTDKVSIRGCDKGDIVLLCLDESHDQYVVFTVLTYLHFLHSDSLEPLGLRFGADGRCRKSWILAEVVEKEFCLAKKAHNRFRVPQGTCFYRVKCKPWTYEGDYKTLMGRPLPPAEHDGSSKQGGKGEQGGARPKKSKDCA